MRRSPASYASARWNKSNDGSVCAKLTVLSYAFFSPFASFTTPIAACTAAAPTAVITPAASVAPDAMPPSAILTRPPWSASRSSIPPVCCASAPSCANPALCARENVPSRTFDAFANTLCPVCCKILSRSSSHWRRLSLLIFSLPSACNCFDVFSLAFPSELRDAKALPTSISSVA